MAEKPESKPAAFGRLCVETVKRGGDGRSPIQPPSGGCVLKLPIHQMSRTVRIPAAFGRLCVETTHLNTSQGEDVQPPSGGCVLKPADLHGHRICRNQPPSGGCVLKRFCRPFLVSPLSPAAFGRLCVETAGRTQECLQEEPAAFGRLCVETAMTHHRADRRDASRLRAAVC